jgi:hypothetical protein
MVVGRAMAVLFFAPLPPAAASAPAASLRFSACSAPPLAGRASASGVCSSAVRAKRRSKIHHPPPQAPRIHRGVGDL